MLDLVSNHILAIIGTEGTDQMLDLVSNHILTIIYRQRC
jgi:hypothetical protein